MGWDRERSHPICFSPMSATRVEGVVGTSAPWAECVVQPWGMASFWPSLMVAEGREFISSIL
jgi:hypothetical protein